jgi:hypothetical protein
MPADTWVQNGHLAAVRTMIAMHASSLEEERAKAANETAMREALFQLHRLVSATVEGFSSNPILLAAALLLVKRNGIDSTPFCVSANYSGWDDKQRAAELKEFVEKTIVGCRQSLGEADFALFLKAFEYEFGGRASLLEYDALWDQFEQTDALIQVEEDKLGARREWEARRDQWIPNRVLRFFWKSSLYGTLASLLLLVLQRILEELRVQTMLSMPTVRLDLGEALGISAACFLFFGLVQVAASLRGRRIYGPAPPKSDWPPEGGVSHLRREVVAKRFPRYAVLSRSLEAAKAAMEPYDRRHGVSSRAEIGEQIKAAESQRDSLFQRHNISAFPTWN